MRTALKSVPILLLCACPLYVQAADIYKVDPAHSSVGFAVRHLVISTVKGKFNEFNGTVTLDNGAITAAQGTIQTKSIDTGVPQRDADLRSANFFNVQKYPEITFKSKRVETKSGHTLLIGDYTMHGVTKELALPVTLTGPIKDPWGNSRIGLEIRTKINRKDFGMVYNKVLETGGVMVGDEIDIDINAEAVKANPK